LAKLSYERTKGLFDNDIAPRKEWELMEDKLIHARSEAQRARLELANLGADNLRLDNRFVLHSLISGIVTERNQRRHGSKTRSAHAPIRHFQPGSIVGPDGYF
jgi:membrane fusion protein, heavy metal efflux system